MRRATASTLAVLVLGALLVAVLVFGVGSGGQAASDVGDGGNVGDGGDVYDESAVGDADDGEEPSLVSVGDAEVWPYVAPAPSFDRRASSINVVVAADPDRIRRYLLREEAWNRSNGTGVAEAVEGPEADAPLDTEVVPWRDAPGGTRYAYVADEGWTAEQYQLHRGTYFGSRHHLRAYGVQDGEWTAIQAHAEHWDWFTITHTVDSVEQAQRRVEAGFLGEPALEVSREPHGNGDTYDADGWTTVVLVALAPLLARRRLRDLLRRFGSVATRRNQRRAALAGSLAALPLVVRFGGILFERHLAWLSSTAVVAVWYPVLVVGVPLAAYWFGRRLPKAEAGTLAALGFGTGLVLDYAYLGIGVLPIPVAVHRVVVVAAVGLLAAGGRSETDSDSRWTASLRAGVALWVVAVVAGHPV